MFVEKKFLTCVHLSLSLSLSLSLPFASNVLPFHFLFQFFSPSFSQYFFSPSFLILASPFLQTPSHPPPSALSTALASPLLSPFPRFHPWRLFPLLLISHPSCPHPPAVCRAILSPFARPIFQSNPNLLSLNLLTNFPPNFPSSFLPGFP